MNLASGRATQENALRYMRGMMDMYQNAYRSLPPAVNPFEFLQGHWGQPGVAGRSAEEPRADQPPAAAASTMKGSEVEELKHRIEELESLLTRHGPKKKSAPKRKSRRKS
jgi:hypothetical protein